MSRHPRAFASTLRSLLLVALVLVPALQAAAQETYQVDPAHTSVAFKIMHMDLTYVIGRFNKVSGDVTTSENAAINLVIQADSVDTGVEQRDTHLRSPDFFSVKEFPTITFKSTSIEPSEGNLVTINGQLTLHGVTKPISIKARAAGPKVGPDGSARVGYYAEFPITRSEFGMNFGQGMIGDEVELMVGIEAVRK